MAKDKELNAQAHALASWFHSQQISPENAAMTMAALTSVILAEKATSRKDLQEGLKALSKDMGKNALQVYEALHD